MQNQFAINNNSKLDEHEPPTCAAVEPQNSIPRCCRAYTILPSHTRAVELDILLRESDKMITQLMLSHLLGNVIDDWLRKSGSVHTFIELVGSYAQLKNCLSVIPRGKRTLKVQQLIDVATQIHDLLVEQVPLKNN